MGCDLVKMRDELLGELYSSGATPKAIEIAKLQIESEIYNIRMTSKKVKNTEEFNIEEKYAETEAGPEVSNVSNFNNLYKKGFNGYVSIKDTGGKGSTEGDGKDKAMREVANGFIGEIANGRLNNSSTGTSYNKLKDKYSGKTGIDSVTYYGPEKPSVVMLARNGSFLNKELNDETKELIYFNFKDDGSIFVVGDMPGVDTQFIEYLEEIGATYTVYTTNNPGKEFDRKGIDGSKYRNIINNKSESAYEIRPGVFTNKNQTKAINEIKEFYNDNSKTSFLVKGRGGTGKTTIIGKAIEEIILSSNGKIKEEDVAFITPSHKTVGVLQSSLSGTKFQKNDVRTIDSALGFTLDKEKDAFIQTDESRQNIKNFAYHPNKDFKAYPKIVIIDEASMVSSEKYNALIETAKKTGVNMKLIFMGDNVQHAPVNDIVNGKVLRESYVFDQVKDQATLTERMRQGEESPIVPITDLIANEIEKPNYSGKFENIKFDGIDKLNSDKTEGVEYSTVAEKSNTFKKFIEDFKKNPNGTRWIHFNNSFNKNTHILIPEIRESVFGKENASSNEFLKGEQITLISNLQIDLTPNKIITFNKESPFVIKSIDKEFHYEDFSYTDYKFGRVNGVFPKVTISLPVVTATISDGVLDHNRIRLVTQDGLNDLRSKGLFSTDKLTDMRVGSFAYDYVINTHRAQGSTYDTVYVDYENIIENVAITKDEDAALKSLYVAVSRPKKKLVIQGYDAGKTNITNKNNTLNINFGTKENKELSNLAHRPFTFKGKKFVSVEHAYQALKSGKFDEKIYSDPRWNNVVNGETVKIKSNKKPKIENNWNVDVLMKTLMIASFNQNENARRILVNTGNAKLSHTQGDKIWSKEFPRLLTEIREKYNENKSSEPGVAETTSDLEVKDNTGKDASVKIVNNFIDNATQDNIKNTIQGIFKAYAGTNEIKSNKKNTNLHKSIVFGPIDYSYTSGKETITHKAKPIVNEDINKLIAKAEEADGVPAGYYNQVLINEYAQGIGMGMHTDAEPIYRHNNDAIGKVAIISIGNIKSTNKSAFGSENKNVDVTSGSLATMSTGSIRHSVGQADTGGRISITLRHIPEVNVKTTQAIKLAESGNEVFPIIESTSVELTPGSVDKISTDGIISGSGPKEWRTNEDSDMLMMDMGFDNITTFIDKLVGLTGDMSKRSNNASYHTQLKSIIDNIKNMMNEYKFDKQIRVVLLNTEDTFTNATFESYPEVTMIEDKDGVPRLYSGMLTLRYGKDYDSKKRQNIRTDENGNQTSEVLDSYENAMSGFRELVLHEMLHAMIDEAMRYDNDLYAKAKAIQKRFAGKVTAKSMTEAMKDISGFEATADHYTQMNDIVKYINGSPVEFLTYALTNPMVYEILDKSSGSASMELITTIKRDPTVKKSIFATIIDMLIKTINNVYSITKIGKGKPLDTLNNIVLNAMAKGIVTAGLNDAEKQREIQGSKYESYNLGEGVLNVSANYRKYEDKIKEFNAKTFDRAMAKDGRIKLGARVEAAARWMNKFEFIKDNKEKGRFRLFSDIANTVLEDTTSKDGGAADFYKLFREIKGNRDRDKVGMTQVARNYLDELWKDQEPEVRNSMTYMLQADWKGLGLSLEEYGNIVANDEIITKEIEALKSKIKAVEYINGAKDLGYYIVHGVSKSPELMRNAKMIYNRAYDIKRKPLVQYSEPDAIADIDKLASLYALRFMDKSTRTNLAKVINSDIELVEATSNMYYTYYEGQAKKFIATGLDKYLEKGGMRKNTQVPKNFEVLPEDKIRKSRLFAHTKIRIDEATTEAMNDGKTYWLVVSDDYGVSRTQGGFDDIHIIDKGMGLRNIREDAMDLSSMHEMIDARSRKAPYYLNKTSGDTLAEMNQLPSQLVPAFDIYGNVIDYEIPISEYDRKQAGMINDIAETLSRTISHIHSKENAVGNNVKFAQMLIKDSTENSGKPGYVLLRPSTIDEIASGTRHRYDEEWAMIPNYIQRMIISRDENGLAVRDGLWVKEGRINNIIGYKDASIVNMKLFGKDKPMLENNPEVRRALEVLEYYWKQIAGRYKEIVVKLFPNVVYGNFTSNMWVAMRHGIGPMEYAKAFKRHWSGLTDYLEMSEELTKLNLMQDAGKTGLDSQIKELENRMSLNSFDKLIKDGQFSTILEDLDLTGLTGKSHLSDMIDEKVAKGGKIAEKAKSIVDELYINRNTQSHKVIEKLTVFNDIINRSIIAERLTQDLDSISFADKAMKDEKIQDILNYVDMLFVNYSYLDNKYVKYVNDTNIVLFTKYFFRALKANLAMMTRNPLSSLGFEGIDTFVMDLSDSFDQYGSPIDTIARKIFPNPIDMLGDLLVPNIANPIIDGR